MFENWKQIRGYENLYLISDLGKVKSVKRNSILKLGIGRDGYLCVGLNKDGLRSMKRIHRLVALNFLENPLLLREVNHKDGNKHNNCYENLEWCTRSENIIHSYRILGRKACNNNNKKVIKIGQIENQEYSSISLAARENKIDASSISNCCRNIQRYAGGFKWKYVN